MHQVFSKFTYNICNDYTYNKSGIISYKPNISLICANGLIHAIQTITTKAPETIPLTAPARVKPFQ